MTARVILSILLPSGQCRAGLPLMNAVKCLTSGIVPYPTSMRSRAASRQPRAEHQAIGILYPAMVASGNRAVQADQVDAMVLARSPWAMV